MNLPVETLNHWGGNFLNFAGAMLWQSSLLVAVLFALDFWFRRKTRASLRYALWLVLLLKLILPPTLALPTSPAWWWHRTPAAVQPQPRFQNFTVTYDAEPLPEIPQNLPVFTPPQPKLSLAAWALVISVFVSLVLGGWLLARWWQIARIVRRAATAENFSAALSKAWRLAGAPVSDPARWAANSKHAGSETGAPRVRLKIVASRMSPAVCGLFRPVILLPCALAENLSAPQLQAVLLHEIFHLRRRDVWVNLLQSLLQIIYWWQPLVWLANARIRRVREEAVDDAVMLALRDDAEGYAPTLLAVAKLALNRPLASLGLVGILESRSALRQRIERLLDFRAPKTAGLTFASLLAIGAFSAVALPMGEGPSPAEKQSAPNPAATKPQPQLALTFKMTHLESEGILKKQLLEAGVKIPPTIVHDFNNGILFARGTREQLVLVNQTIWRLNGYSPQEIATATNLPDYAIKIPVDEPATPPLFSRTFKLNIDVVSANLLKQTDGQSNAPDSTAVSAAFRELFIRLGLNLESPPGKSIFYNEKLGKLFVKTTASDLDVIELAVMALLQPSTQNTGGHSPPVEATNVVGVTGVLADPNFRAKIHALEQRSGVTSLKEPEMTRRIGHSINQAPASISGAIPASSRPAATTNPAPQLHIKARFVEVPESFLSGAAKNSFPAGMTNGTGILTATAAKKLIKEFESQKDTEWLAEPEVTTTSGRQTQMRTTEVITIITNMMFEENQTNSWIQPATNALETGPIFDVMPTVLADGDTLDLRMTASLKKFFGYPDFPANAKLQTATNSAGEVITLPPVWPAVESWRKSAHVVLWDGQTAVMTLNQPEQVRFAEPDAKREEVVAEQIRAAKKKNHMDGKELIVFVTATIVDPAGNRVHADDDLPSAKTGIPPQPPTK